MSEKRGQAAVFLVILAVLAIAVVFGFIFQKDELTPINTGTKKVLSTEDRNVENFVQECLDLTVKNGLFYLGFVGGRLSPDPFPAYYSFDAFYKIPYYYMAQKNTIPVPYNEGFWTGLLDRYLNNYFEGCIDKFSRFPIPIKGGPLKPTTKFADNTVVFTIDYPVRVQRDFQTDDLESRYTVTIPLRLREILQVSTTIVTKEVKNDRYIHWDYLTQVTFHQYNITAFTEDDDTIVYRITDLKNEIDDEPYILQFASRVG